MTKEKVNLTWPPWRTYTDHLKELLHQMRTDNTFADVTLVSDDGRQVRAHKVVLGACSPTMRNLLTKKDTNIIDLKGIALEEIDSILQFIYLGETTFHEERMKDFLYVAQKLRIKELFTEVDNDIQIDMNTESETQSTINIEYQYEGMEGVKYVYNQCDYQATRQSSLARNIQSKHEGAKYPCKHCDYQATTQSSLTKHIQFKHQGVKYPCSQCDYQASYQGNLTKHIQSEHEGVNMLVISVTFKLHTKVVCEDIFKIYMKVSGILVNSVIIKLHNRVI